MDHSDDVPKRSPLETHGRGEEEQVDDAEQNRTAEEQELKEDFPAALAAALLDELAVFGAQVFAIAAQLGQQFVEKPLRER